MLNENTDGADAPERVEGVVLIDELDLHLHPRWQRDALPRLRAAFPRLQLVVTTHSPQVLSSVEDNRQVRMLKDGNLWDGEVFVAGRDTNSIMREYFGTDDRDSKGAELLQRLDDAIDAEHGEDARALFADLLKDWGRLDPSLIRRKTRVERLK
jgi:predicted ATP-binding protein involved in virulence